MKNCAKLSEFLSFYCLITYFSSLKTGSNWWFLVHASYIYYLLYIYVLFTQWRRFHMWHMAHIRICWSRRLAKAPENESLGTMRYSRGRRYRKHNNDFIIWYNSDFMNKKKQPISLILRISNNWICTHSTERGRHQVNEDGCTTQPPFGEIPYRWFWLGLFCIEWIVSLRSHQNSSRLGAQLSTSICCVTVA